MEKSRYAKVIEGEEVRGDDPIEYFLPMGIRSTFRVPGRELMAIEVAKMKKISGEGKKGGRKGVVSAIRQKRANRGSIDIKQKERGGVG